MNIVGLKRLATYKSCLTPVQLPRAAILEVWHAELAMVLYKVVTGEIRTS